MSKTRNKAVRRKCLERDDYTCQCCGFDGNEAHHIVPLIQEGEDKLFNMVCLCGTCHLFAPNNKEAFIHYKKIGGKRTGMVLGELFLSLRKIKDKELLFFLLDGCADKLLKRLKK